MGVMMEALYHTSLSVVGEVKPESLTRPCLLRKWAGSQRAEDVRTRQFDS